MPRTSRSNPPDIAPPIPSPPPPPCMLCKIVTTMITSANQRAKLHLLLFIYHKASSHHIVKPLLFCSETNHKKSYAEYKSGKYLSKIATRCFPKGHAISRQISYYYPKSHFAERRLFNRTFHNRLIHP